MKFAVLAAGVVLTVAGYFGPPDDGALQGFGTVLIVVAILAWWLA